MAVEIVHETHSLTEGNETGMPTGWLPGRLSPHMRRPTAEFGAVVGAPASLPCSSAICERR